ncbi:hypothetical protein HUU59_10945 [bacterium]|nr:hypothetical protein [bacterium]
MSKTRFGDIPGPIPHSYATPALAADAATIAFPVFRAPVACVVKKIEFVPNAAFTGHDTNRKNLNIIYKGADGSTGAAEVANLDLTATPAVNLVAFDAKNIPLNATYVNGVTMAEGDVLAFEIEDAGTSPAFGPGVLYIEWYPS